MEFGTGWEINDLRFLGETLAPRDAPGDTPFSKYPHNSLFFASIAKEKYRCKLPLSNASKSFALCCVEI